MPAHGTFETCHPAAGMTVVYPQEITRVLPNLISNGLYATNKRSQEAGGDFKPMLYAGTKNLGDTVEIRIPITGPASRKM